jgi:hypothetical protein
MPGAQCLRSEDEEAIRRLEEIGVEVTLDVLDRRTVAARVGRHSRHRDLPGRGVQEGDAHRAIPVAAILPAHLPRDNATALARLRSPLVLAFRRRAAQVLRNADCRAACRTIAEVHVLPVEPVLPADMLHGVGRVHGATRTANGLHEQGYGQYCVDV